MHGDDAADAAATGRTRVGPRFDQSGAARARRIVGSRRGAGRALHRAGGDGADEPRPRHAHGALQGRRDGAGRGDEIAAAARASDADILALHRSFKSIEERHSSFVPSVVDALREGNVPVSAAALLEDVLAAHIGASTVLRNHLLAHAPEAREPRRDARPAPPRARHGRRAPRRQAHQRRRRGGGRRAARLRARLRPRGPAARVHRGRRLGGGVRPGARDARRARVLKNALVATIEKHVAKHGPNSTPGTRSCRRSRSRSRRRPSPSSIAAEAWRIPTRCCASGRTCRRATTGLDEPGGSYNSGSQKPISGVGMGLPCVEIKFRAPDAIDAMLSS